MEGNILIPSLYSLQFLCLLKKLGREFFSQGIYYYKLLEYTLVAKEIRGKNNRVLDIGSGKSFLPLFYLNRGWETWIVDRGDFYSDFDKFYLQLVEDKFPRCVSKLRVVKGDFLNLDLPLNYFDYITAISTLEHFPETMDMMAVRKIASLLNEKGRCILTLPFSQSGTKQRIVCKNNFSFFQRDYELRCVYTRIIEPSELDLKYFYIIGERNPHWGNKFFFHNPWRKFNNLWALFPSLFWKIYYKGKARELPPFKYPGIIVVVMEKKI